MFLELHQLCAEYGIVSVEAKETAATFLFHGAAGSSKMELGPEGGAGDGEANGSGGEEGPLLRRAHAQEVTRYGGAELHTTSALIGGVAAQEAVKVLTHQYVPLDNTYIFNGIASCAATYKL